MTQEIQVLMQGAPAWMQELQGVLRGVGIRAELFSPQRNLVATLRAVKETALL